MHRDATLIQRKSIVLIFTEERTFGHNRLLAAPCLGTRASPLMQQFYI
jgi:hypothetical protein